LKEFFKPEFRNRIDMVCKFAKLDTLAIKKIVVKFTDELQKTLLSRGVKLHLTEALVDHLAKEGYDPKMGARPLSRKIDELLRVPLSKKLLFDNLENVSITADFVDGAVNFRNSIPIVGEDGIIRVDNEQA
jgi:ATP-dependent Clp protease ATP-binding subunit ClpA